MKKPTKEFKTWRFREELKLHILSSLQTFKSEDQKRRQIKEGDVLAVFSAILSAKLNRVK